MQLAFIHRLNQVKSVDSALIMFEPKEWGDQLDLPEQVLLMLAHLKMEKYEMSCLWQTDGHTLKVFWLVSLHNLNNYFRILFPRLHWGKAIKSTLLFILVFRKRVKCKSKRVNLKTWFNIIKLLFQEKCLSCFCWWS